MNGILATVIVLATAAAAVPRVAHAESHEQPPLYAAVHCMKSTRPDYVNLETEIWLPMHQSRVDAGRMNSWALYRVMYGDRSRCDYYTVETFRGHEQLNAMLDYAEVFQAVHPDRDVSAAMGATWAHRQHVASELWILIDSTEIRPHRFATVNLMRAEDPDAYERMESSVFKAGHELLIEAGHRAGWSVYALISPGGTEVPYNYATVDFVDHLNPVPMAEAMMQAHPDRDIEAMHDLLELREHVRSETWALVAATALAAE
jgi:hypothetical protein